MDNIEPLGIDGDEQAFNNRPDFHTQRKEWEDWWNSYNRQQKLKRYYATHKVVVDWDEELIAPPEFFGTWVEIKYIPYNGLDFDYQKEGIESVSSDKAEEFTCKLGDVLELLTLDIGCYSPYIIEIDDQGQCHLLLCTASNDKPHTLDMIIRTGKRRTINVT